MSKLDAGQGGSQGGNQPTPHGVRSASERQFRAVFDCALDCMFLCNDERCCVDVNPAGCALLGLEKSEILGRRFDTLIQFDPAKPVGEITSAWQSFLTAGKTTGESHVSHANGDRLIAEYAGVANIVPGRHLFVLRDVTEQRRIMQARLELNAELERRNRGLIALHGIGVKLGESLDLHDVYETIFREFTYHFLDSPHLAVALYDREKQHFYCDFAVVDGEVYDPSAFPPMPLGEGPTTRAFRELTPQIIDIEALEATLPSERIIHIGNEASPRSGLYVPLVVNNEAIGVLSVQHYDAHAFQDMDLTLLSVMANHAAAAIANALLYQQTQQEIADRKRRERELAAIAALSRDLRAVQGEASVLATLLRQVQELFEAIGVAIVLDVEPAPSIADALGQFAALAGGTAPEDLELGRTTVINEPDELAQSVWRGDDIPLRDATRDAGRLQGLASIPLSVQNTSLGALVIGLDRPVTPEDTALLASLADMTASTLQRARLYEEVQLQAQRLMRVMDTVVFGLLLLDKDRRILIANQPALGELETLAQAGVGDKLTALADVPIETILTTSHGGVYGCEIVLHEHPSKIYDVLANPVEIDGETDGWVLVIRDITQDRELQAQLQRQDRLAAVGQLAAGIAHDFNNVLAVIVLYVQMLQRSPNLKESEQKRLTVIRDQAQHASALVRQVLDFSRMSVMERRHVDLVELVRTSMRLWERILPENIRLVFTVRDGASGDPSGSNGDLSHDAVSDEPSSSDLSSPKERTGAFVVDGDAARLQQVLMNLALNARDAMPDGGTLRLDLGLVDLEPGDKLPAEDLTPGSWIQLSVEDTGEGIVAELLPHIFDPFFTTKGVGKGTGLGLAQVYGIVHQHGGQVTVDSQPDEGTAFHIYLPPVETNLARPETDGDEGMAAEGSGRILLVEDNQAARDATRAILEMYGYEVIEAENGRIALRQFHLYGESIDLILSDFVMPEMGGIALFQAVARLKPTLPFLFMTGYPLDDEDRRLIEVGTVDWLQKPFSIQDLAEKVRKLLA